MANCDLKPCPFCGGGATYVKHSAGVPRTMAFDSWDAVACRACGATVGACDRRFRNKDDAASAWNLRAQGVGECGEQEIRDAIGEVVARVVHAAPRPEVGSRYWPDAKRMVARPCGLCLGLGCRMCKSTGRYEPDGMDSVYGRNA